MSGGDRFRTCGFLALSRCGNAAWLVKNVPRAFTVVIRSYFLLGVCSVPGGSRDMKR